MVQTNQPQGNVTATTTPNDGPATQSQTTPARSSPLKDINVTGMERMVSVGGGLLLVGKGLRKGGLFGLISLAMGGAAIFRGMTGHCEMKKKMMEKMG